MERPDYIKPKQEVEVQIPEGATEASLGAEFMRLKTDLSAAEEIVSNIKAEMEKVEGQLASLMEARKIDKFTAGGVTFFTKEVNYPSVKVADQEALFAWLDEHGHGAIAKRTIHPMTLRSWVTDQLEEGEALPSQINNFTKTRVNTRRNPGK